MFNNLSKLLCCINPYIYCIILSSFCDFYMYTYLYIFFRFINIRCFININKTSFATQNPKSNVSPYYGLQIYLEQCSFELMEAMKIVESKSS